MKIHIQNFQSLKDVTLDVSGFTVLTGRSNLGKSAVIRAVEGALFNSPADAYIREGSSHLEVRLSSPEFDITWRKGGGHNDYEVDGQAFENVGRDVPDVIRQKGFKDLELNKNTLRVQVSDQFHPLFLLDCSGTDAAQAISDVNRIYEIQQAQDAVDKDRRSLRAELKVREKDLEQATQRVLLLNSLEDSTQPLKVVLSRAQGVKQARTRVQALKAHAYAYTRAQARIRALARVGDIEIPRVPTTRHVEMQRDVRQGVRLQRSLDSYREIPIPTIPNPLRAEIFRDLKTLQRLHRAAPLVMGLTRLDLPSPPDDRRVTDLKACASRLKNLAANIHVLKSEIQQTNEEITSLESQIHAMVPDHGTCPLCGQATNQG